MNQKRKARIEWLLKHQDMWEGWMNQEDHRHERIVDAMKKDGMISEKTHWYDVPLTNLIHDARTERRERKQ